MGDALGWSRGCAGQHDGPLAGGTRDDATAATAVSGRSVAGLLPSPIDAGVVAGGGRR